MPSPGKMEAFPSVLARPHVIRKTSAQETTRRRRKNSTLGGDPRGDTAAGSITTNLPRQPPADSPTSPINGKKSEKGARERKRTKAKKVFRRWKRLSLRHTWVNPLILILLLLSAYFVNPGEQNPLHPAIFLSYANPPMHERTTTLPAHIGDVTQYGKGRKDFAFVAFYTLVLTFTREFLMQRLIRPIALYYGIRSRGKQSRFMEQLYTAIYFAIFGPFGLWVMSRTPVWYFNTVGMYAGFPHRAHEACFKTYYLLQAAYWAQQGFVLLLQLEKPRKDFKELVLHHIITLALIALSYRFHFAYMGIAVYITHDISDFFLATSKCLNYIDSIFTAPYFVTFMAVWAYSRHYLNLIIIKSLLPVSVGTTIDHHWTNTVYPYVPAPLNGYLPANNTGIITGEFSTVGPYEVNWETQQYKCWIAQPIAFALLASLQAVNLFWFFLIGRILLRYVLKAPLKDERSEDEEEEGEEQHGNGEPVAVQVNGNGSVKANGHANGHAIKPQIAVNGRPLEKANGKPATGVESKGKQNKSSRKR